MNGQYNIKLNLINYINNEEYDLFKEYIKSQINLIDKTDLFYINLINRIILRKNNIKIHKQIILLLLDLGFNFTNKLLLQNICYNIYEKFLIKLYKKFNIKFDDNDYKNIENNCLFELIKVIYKKEGFTKNILNFYDKHYKLLDLTLPSIYKKLFKIDLKDYSRLNLLITAKKNDYKRKIDLISKLTPFYKDIGDIIYEYHL